MAYLIVDHKDEPELLKDKFWDEIIPTELVYTIGAEIFKNTEFEGSAERSLKIKKFVIRSMERCILKDSLV